MDIVDIATTRYTTKSYDASRSLTDDQVENLRKLLRFSPSSTNAQPWHFVLATTQQGKDRIADGGTQPFPFNAPSIRNASAVVVFCARTTLDDAFLAEILEQEDADGRYPDPSFKAQMDGGRKMFIDFHRYDFKDLNHWMEKQVYLNVGQFLLGCGALGLDATPMEGIDFKALDETLGLREKGFTSVVVVPVGFHDPETDYNKALPKSRLPYETLLTEL